MKKTLIILSGIVFMILFVWFYISIADFTPSDDKIFMEKITRLESKIDSLKNQKDSIKTVIDSTHVKIITNEKHYQEVVNTIISQPTSADYEYITNYILIRQSSNKRDSSDLCRKPEIKY